MRFYSLEKLINLYDGYRKLIKIDQHNLLLLQTDGELVLLESHCPHRGHPLTEASVAGGRIQCPAHGYSFRLDNGQSVRVTEEPCRDLKVYELIYEATEVGVML